MNADGGREKDMRSIERIVLFRSCQALPTPSLSRKLTSVQTRTSRLKCTGVSVVRLRHSAATPERTSYLKHFKISPYPTFFFPSSILSHVNQIRSKLRHRRIRRSTSARTSLRSTKLSFLGRRKEDREILDGPFSPASTPVSLKQFAPMYS